MAYPSSLFSGTFKIDADDLRMLREMGCVEKESHKHWIRSFESDFVCIDCERFSSGSLQWYGAARPLAGDRVSSPGLRVLLQGLQDKLKRLISTSNTISASIDDVLTWDAQRMERD
jgi:hypothetical protein